MSETASTLESNHPTGDPASIPLAEFVNDFGDSLLEAVSKQNPPVFDGELDPEREAIMDGFKRSPFVPQRAAVQAITCLLADAGERATILNGEMGTGKTLMAIATAALLHRLGYRRTLVIAPPHLVYKWRREILETIEGARVEILNGPATLRQLLKLRDNGADQSADRPSFFILGRVRMRIGFRWRPAYVVRRRHVRENLEHGTSRGGTRVSTFEHVACPRCGAGLTTDECEPLAPGAMSAERRQRCAECGEPLWTLERPRSEDSQLKRLHRTLCKMPTIGPKTADRLIAGFGVESLSAMLEDNVYEFVNLMDADGEFVFSDRQARRMERALATQDIAFGQGGYQASEFIKRYLPQGFFDLAVVDEGHEYKGAGSAQGQAMGVLAAKARKVLLLTGTLMGGYADDLFHLLWRLLPHRMIEDGFHANTAGSLGPATMAFMREHGVLKDIYKETDEGHHATARGKRMTQRTSKAPGFGPAGVARFVLPYTVFVKLRDMGEKLPAYAEHFIDVAMTPVQHDAYQRLQSALETAMKSALVAGDRSLLGVVLNTLLAWPDTAFREEVARHPRTRALLHYVAPVFDERDVTPKEQALIEQVQAEKRRGRRVLVYTTYTGTRDTTARLRHQLSEAGLNVAVLKASVGTAQREDWIMDQVERGVDVLVTNPELVKTGLDLIDFPTLVFLQSGFNVYTLMQAARRSWRIGQTEPVDVYFMGYQETAQMACLRLMAQKIAVTQSTSGDMPETGLDVLNQSGESVEVALARQLLAA